MAMQSGADGLKNEPNMTPMIDVLLVLLIIFMMIIPMGRKAIDVQLPDPTPVPNSKPDPNQIVLEVLPGPTFQINRTGVTLSDTRSETRIETIYATPRGANSRPSMPDRAKSGMNTRITIAVPKTIAPRISMLAS